MSDPSVRARPNVKNMGVILLIFAATIFGAMRLGGLGTREGNLEAAAAIAAGTALLAAMTWRFSRPPRWAYAVSVFVLAASAMGSAWLSPDIIGWKHGTSGALSMHPWYFLTLVSAGPGARACCAGQSSGWTIVLGALAIAAVAPLVGFLR